MYDLSRAYYREVLLSIARNRIESKTIDVRIDDTAINNGKCTYTHLNWIPSITDKSKVSIVAKGSNGLYVIFPGEYADNTHITIPAIPYSGYAVDSWVREYLMRRRY